MAFPVNATLPRKDSSNDSPVCRSAPLEQPRTHLPLSAPDQSDSVFGEVRVQSRWKCAYCPFLSGSHEVWLENSAMPGLCRNTLEMPPQLSPYTIKLKSPVEKKNFFFLNAPFRK